MLHDTRFAERLQTRPPFSDRGHPPCWVGRPCGRGYVPAHQVRRLGDVPNASHQFPGGVLAVVFIPDQAVGLTSADVVFGWIAQRQRVPRSFDRRCPCPTAGSTWGRWLSRPHRAGCCTNRYVPSSLRTRHPMDWRTSEAPSRCDEFSRSPARGVRQTRPERVQHRYARSRGGDEAEEHSDRIVVSVAVDDALPHRSVAAR